MVIFYNFPQGMYQTVTHDLAPGVFVRHPDQTDWGIGQVQSVIDCRVTVNFEHQGKQLINAAVIELKIVTGYDY